MKKIFTVLLSIIIVASLPLAASARVGVDFSSMISSDNPYNYVMSFAPISLPMVSSVQRVGLVFDVTDQFSLAAGISSLSTTANDFDALTVHSGGYSLGGRMRLSQGTLSPVLGLGIDVISFDSPDFPMNMSSADIYGTVGVEWTVIPNMLFLLDIRAIDLVSGTGQFGDEDFALDNQTRILRSGTFGFRWYFM